MARILLIDDDQECREAIRVALENLGHVVFEAADGKTGMARVAEAGIELIITDVLMPGTDGVEVIGAMRRLHPQVKIIAMSGGGHVSGTNYLKLAKKMGATEVLAKPFSQDELAETIWAVFPHLPYPRSSGGQPEHP